MAQKTKAQRIIDLFDYLWPTERWHIRNDSYGDDRATVEVRSQDKMNTFARVHFAPKMDLSYEIQVTYPGVSGTLDEMVEPAAVISTLLPVLRKMQETALIQKGE